jgi:SAM-dependent methyltransferase
MTDTSFHMLIATANRLAAGNFRQFWRSFLVPLDYTRTREIPALLRSSGILRRTGEELRILDIGSPQILSLALARASGNWQVTYVNPFEPELAELRRSAPTLGLGNLEIANADITRPETLAHLGTFDYVFSCSVFEHIHPEHGGDVVAARNVAPLLNPGGRFVFSVPYAKEKFNEYVAGDVYANKGAASGRTFFQRFYDERSLNEQLLDPSGLQLSGATYIGERHYHEDNIHKRLAFLVGFGRRALILGRFFRVLSGIFMEESEDWTVLRKPYLAVCALVKD